MSTFKELDTVEFLMPFLDVIRLVLYAIKIGGRGVSGGWWVLVKNVHKVHKSELFDGYERWGSKKI